MTLELGGSRSLRCLAGGLCRGAGQGRVPWPCRESSEEEEEDRERERAPEGKTFCWEESNHRFKNQREKIQ